MFQNPLLAISHRLRSTPFQSRVNAAGVKAYTVYNHMLLPAVFDSLENDYWHLREAVQVWDVAGERQVELKGPDAFRLTQLMTPRNVGRCQIGQCMYAPLVDEHGAILNDPVILKLAEDRFWISIADSDVLFWAKGLATGYQLDVDVFEPDVSPLAVQGPKSFDLMANAFGEWVRDIRFFRFREHHWNGLDLIIARSGWSKQGGFEIYLPDSARGEELWDHVFEAGKDLDVKAGCPNLIERIEGGLLSFGNDMTMEHNPLECGLDAYCDLPDGAEVLCADALRKIQDDGVTRKITGVTIGGDPISPVPTWVNLSSNGADMGVITSACWSPRLKKNIAIAMLDNDGFDSENLEATLDGETRSITVEGLPFAD